MRLVRGGNVVMETFVIGTDPIKALKMGVGGGLSPMDSVAEVSKREKAAFPRERKTPPLEVGVGGKTLFALIWLNKLRK